MSRLFLRVFVALLATSALSFVLLTSDPLAFFGYPKDHDAGLPDLVSDKIQHAVSYAILTFVLIAAIGRVDARSLAVAGLLALLHGAATEYLQYFVPQRTPDWLDFAANLTGIALVLLGSAVLARRSRVAERQPVRV